VGMSAAEVSSAACRNACIDMRDRILLAVWVLSYAVVLRVFTFLRSFEKRDRKPG
jgi:hypothetical protein